MLSREEIVEALGRVIDPELRRPVTELDMVRGVQIDGANVVVTIALTVVGCPLRSSFEDQVQQHVASLPGVASVSLQFDVMTPDERAALTTRLRGGADVRGVQLPATTRVLAVASGKGGVGKSTLTVNIAAAIASLGREVGILDADIYGHSIPHMLGISRKPVVVDKMIVPPVAHDLKLCRSGSSSTTTSRSCGAVRCCTAHSSSSCRTFTGAISMSSSSTCRPVPVTSRSHSDSCCRVRRRS